MEQTFRSLVLRSPLVFKKALIALKLADLFLKCYVILWHDGSLQVTTVMKYHRNGKILSYKRNEFEVSLVRELHSQKPVALIFPWSERQFITFNQHQTSPLRSNFGQNFTIYMYPNNQISLAERHTTTYAKTQQATKSPTSKLTGNRHLLPAERKKPIDRIYKTLHNGF